MTTDPLQPIIEEAWERRDSIDGKDGAVREAVEAAILRLDSGEERVAEKAGGEWRVNQWLKKAVLLSFRLNPMEAIPGGPGGAPWWDKVPSKFLGWGPDSFAQAGFRAVPGAIVRRGAYIAPGAVLMPSFGPSPTSMAIGCCSTGSESTRRTPRWSRTWRKTSNRRKSWE